MADMAEAAFKRMIATFIRQTRPQSFRRGKPSHYPQRSVATAPAAKSLANAEGPVEWQSHALSGNHTSDTSASRPRLDKLRSDLDTQPFSSFLTDNFAREHNYLRISVTERCNLRCLYCMPEEGVPLSPPVHNLTTPEIVYLSSLFVNQGVDKIRLTGGEPTVRKDIVDLMRQIGELRKDGLKELCLTTNGISLHRKLDAMVESGLTGVNLSLDTLDPFQFTIMTRRNGHDAVMKSINRILEMNKVGAGIKLKINCVVMRGMNEREIVPFVELGKDRDLEVRFIEYMPFDGNKWSRKKMLPYKEMLSMIQEKYPTVQQVQGHLNDTSKTYKIPGFAGRIGFITSMTHNFCGTCNRLRITSDGNLKVCLFGNSEVSLRDILRESNEGKPIDPEAMDMIKQVELDHRRASPGIPSSISLSPIEGRLLDVIGMAVKRKKEKHAGMVIPIKFSHTYKIDQHRSTFAPKLATFLSSSTIPKFSVPLHLLHSQNQKFARQYHCSARHFYRSQPRRTIIRAVSGQNTHRRVPVISGSTDFLVDGFDSSDSTRLHEQSNPTDKHLNTASTTLDGEDGLDNDINVDDWVMREGFCAAAEEPPVLEPPTTEPNYTPVTSMDSNVKSGLLKKAAFSKKTKPVSAHVKNAVSGIQESSVSRLTHLTSKGEAHMVDISQKKVTNRSATAMSKLVFGGAKTVHALNASAVGKGDVIAVARIAGIQAAKITSDLIPLAHPGLGLTGVSIDISSPKINTRTPFGSIEVTAKVSCSDKTGVEMEALTAATVTTLTLFDMLKGVDKGMVIEATRVIAKSGGKSGDWIHDVDATKKKFGAARVKLDSKKSSMTCKKSASVAGAMPTVNSVSPTSEIDAVKSDVIKGADESISTPKDTAFLWGMMSEVDDPAPDPSVSTSASSDILPDSKASALALPNAPISDMISYPISRSRSDEIGYLSLKEREFQVSLKRMKWREERLRHERQLLDLQAEVTQLERRKTALAERDIEAEIQRGIDMRLRKMGANKKLMAMEVHAARRLESGETAPAEITERNEIAADRSQSTILTGDSVMDENNTGSALSSSYFELPTQSSKVVENDSTSAWSSSPSHSESEKLYNPEVTTIRLRDLTSGLGLDKADAGDFQQSRFQRYKKWSDER